MKKPTIFENVLSITGECIKPEHGYAHYYQQLDGVDLVLRSEYDALNEKYKALDSHWQFVHSEMVDRGLAMMERIQQLEAKVQALESENEKLKETISYLPKVPTQPYEKELAERVFRYEVALKSIVHDFQLYGARGMDCATIADEALRGGNHE